MKLGTIKDAFLSVIKLQIVFIKIQVALNIYINRSPLIVAECIFSNCQGDNDSNQKNGGLGFLLEYFNYDINILNVTFKNIKQYEKTIMMMSSLFMEQLLQQKFVAYYMKALLKTIILSSQMIKLLLIKFLSTQVSLWKNSNKRIF